LKTGGGAPCAPRTARSDSFSQAFQTGITPGSSGVEALRTRLPDALRERHTPAEYAAIPKHLILDHGAFAQLDVELTLQILQLLPLRDKLVCCIAVCRGWRSFKNTTASPLFTVGLAS
jgi:hypothetical protein